jgi:hypothetical protein
LEFQETEFCAIEIVVHKIRILTKSILNIDFLF